MVRLQTESDNDIDNGNNEDDDNHACERRERERERPQNKIAALAWCAFRLLLHAQLAGPLLHLANCPSARATCVCSPWIIDLEHALISEIDHWQGDRAIFIACRPYRTERACFCRCQLPPCRCRCTQPVYASTCILLFRDWLPVIAFQFISRFLFFCSFLVWIYML